MKEIKAFIHPHCVSPVISALNKLPHAEEMIVFDLQAFGYASIRNEEPQDGPHALVDHIPYAKVEVLCPNDLEFEVITTMSHHMQSDGRRNGKIYVCEVARVIEIEGDSRAPATQSSFSNHPN